MFASEDLISAYTRAEAIEDGVLIDVSKDAREAGWKYPVAMTLAAWEDFVAWSDADTQRKQWPQDQAGRLWDVVFMGRLAARGGDSGGERLFAFYRTPRDGKARKPVKVLAKLHCGPGDNGEPVITIMLPGED
jgi:hypothetical protein